MSNFNFTATITPFVGGLANQLSFIKGDSSWYTWRGKDWEYAFSVEFNPTNDRIELRVERRPKQPPA
ncbi:hypothetical protein [Herbaspirillum camelliae]|uniref:hypothetical protein n=1 Tax=Herbaspirillum camelliae TaxID=1892903 RepID=UPI000A8C8003|nr:hypothetical protein [Herbaspirillum camelliae]